MTDSWTPYQYMNRVPSDEIKVWQITRTSASLVVVCNGVTVVNFNFATDYRDGHDRCHHLWTRQSTAIVFNYSHGMYGSYGRMFMRIPGYGKYGINILIWILKFIMFKVQ